MQIDFLLFEPLFQSIHLATDNEMLDPDQNSLWHSSIKKQNTKEAHI
jgi:hypothetical protein